MKKYTVKRKSDNKILSEWDSEFSDHTHYEENWGKPEHQEIDVPYHTIEHEEIPAVLDADGVEISPAIPAWFEHIPATYKTIPSEFIIEEIDITAEVEAKRRKKEKKENDHKDRKTSLKSIDWKTINTIAELKAIVQHLVNDNLKDEE